MKYEAAVYAQVSGTMITGLCSTEPGEIESFLISQALYRGDHWHGSPFEPGKPEGPEFWKVFGDSVVYTVTEIKLDSDSALL